MNRYPDWLPELKDLLDRLQDGDFTEPDRLRLNELLRAGAQQRRCFITYLDVHSRLAWEGGQEGSGVRVPGSGEPVGRGQANDECGMMNDELPTSVFTGDIHQSSFINHHCDASPVVPPIILDLPPTAHRWQLIGLSSVGSFAFSYVVAAMIVGVGLLLGWAWRTSSFQELADIGSWQVPPARAAKIPTVGRISGMIDCQWTEWSVVSGQWSMVSESEIPNQERLVPLGAKYHLALGFMEITYDTGAKVILQGPCTYEIESASGGFLSLGKLTARVETRAEGGGRRAEGEAGSGPYMAGGKSEIQRPKSESLTLPSALRPPPSALFSVRTPTAIVTDLGTEFAVEVDRSGASRAHVFRGRIELRPTGGNGSHLRLSGPDGAAQKSPSPAEDGNRPVQLKENESATVAVDREGTVTVVRETGQADEFARQMPKRVPIKLFNTGLGLKEGEPDPHWRLTAVSNDPKFKPRPAVVSSLPYQIWLANDPDRSQWISTADGMPNLPHGVTYTFRTTFQLVDVMPETAVLQGWFIVDNYIRAIRLNGKEVPVPEHGDGSNGVFHQFYRFVARRGFVEGTNVLEMDVYNGLRGPPPKASASAMALRVELEGSVRGKASAPPGETHRTAKQKEGISMK